MEGLEKMTDTVLIEKRLTLASETSSLQDVRVAFEEFLEAAL